MPTDAKTCKTCKWWVKDVIRHRAEGVMEPIDPDTWEPMKMPFEVRVCTSPRLLFYERPVESNQAAVIDGSEYYAALITAEDFYCVNHESS